MIALDQVVKTFGQTRAVDGVSFQVEAGRIFGLVGPDGAGKTTLLRCICWALKPDSGSIRVGGFDAGHQSEKAQALIGYLSQRFSLYEDLTVLENLQFFAEVRGLQRQDWRERSRMLLEFVGLAEFGDRLAGQLSGGMKQKLGLALALINRPRVLLLDEPTTGVDPITRQDFWQLIIRQVNQEGLTVLVSTPYMDEAARCHRIGFLRSGRMVVQGAPGDLRSLLDGRMVEVTGTPVEALQRLARQVPGVQSAQRFGNRLHLMVEPQAVERVSAQFNELSRQEGLHIERSSGVPSTLEDVFIALSEGML